MALLKHYELVGKELMHYLVCEVRYSKDFIWWQLMTANDS